MWEISGVEAFHWGTGCQSQFDCTELQTNLSQLSYAHPTVFSTKWKKKIQEDICLTLCVNHDYQRSRKNSRDASKSNDCTLERPPCDITVSGSDTNEEIV